MHQKLTHFATGTAALALLAGCSGGGTGLAAPPAAETATQSTAHTIISDCASAPMLPSHSPSALTAFVDPGELAKARSLIAVSDVANNLVHVYDATGKYLAALGGFAYPQGLSSDTAGNLYVADTDNSRVQVYAKGMQGTPTTLLDTNHYPTDVDSFRNGKIVAVTNTRTCGGDGSVSFFVDGQLSKTVTSPSLHQASFCAFDAAGNLYVDGSDADGNFVVGEIVAGADGSTFTPRTIANHIVSPGAVEVTTDGHLAIADRSSRIIYTYEPRSAAATLGAPTSTTVLAGTGALGGFAFTRSLESLYVADQGSFEAAQFAYPGGGAPTSTTTISGSPVGVAVVPSQVPKNL